MIKIISKTLFFLGVLFYLFHFLFFWLFESTDSLFYVTFASFLKTGKYFMPHPYYYTAPSTMEPPLYSVFLFFAQILPRADIIIHFVQVAAIVISSLLIYKIFQKYTRSEIALVVATSFLLAPAHSIYISNLVAEPIAVFFIVSYVYIVHLVLNEKKTELLSWLLILSSVMVLHRYNLIVFYGFTLVLFTIRLLVPPPRAIPPPQGWCCACGTPLGCSLAGVPLGFLISIVVLSSWVMINNRLNGSWGLSNAEGKHLYNRILHFDRLLPDEDTPSFVKFKSIVGEGKDYFKPWWFYEPALIGKLGSETESSNLLREVALSALASNPIKYIIDTPGFFFFAHGDNPTYHDPLYLYSGKMKEGCRTLGNIQFCKPILSVPSAHSLWDFLVKVADWYYLYVSRFVNFFLLFPAIIFALVKKDKFIRYVAILYLASILFFVIAEAPIPRYTYIFTPLKAILIGYFLINLISRIVIPVPIPDRN